MSRKGIDNLLSNTNHLTQNHSWKSKLLYTSPIKRPNSRTAIPSKLEEYVKSPNKIVPKGDTDTKKSRGPICKECVLLLRMQSNLSQEFAEKEIRLGKCLRFIDQLIQENDIGKAKLRVLEEENHKLTEKMRILENYRSDGSSKDLLNSKTVSISKVSESSKLTASRKQPSRGKPNDKLAIIQKQNTRLKALVEQLEKDKQKLTSMKYQADRNHQFMENLHNTFKARMAESDKSKSRSMKDMRLEDELKVLKDKCLRLQGLMKDNIQQPRGGTVSTIAPSMKLISEENLELKEKLTEIKEMYEVAERARLQLQSKFDKEKEGEKEKATHTKKNGETQLKQAVSHLHEEILKWQQVIVEKDEAILELQRQSADKLDQIEVLKEKIEELQDRKEKSNNVDSLVETLNNELSIYKKQNQSLRDQLTVDRQRVKGLTQDHTNQAQTLQAQVTKLNFELNQLKFKNKKLIASEASSIQKVLLLQDKIKQQQKAFNKLSKADSEKTQKYSNEFQQIKEEIMSYQDQFKVLEQQNNQLKDSIRLLESQIAIQQKRYQEGMEKNRQQLEKAKLNAEKLDAQLKQALQACEVKDVQLKHLSIELEKLKTDKPAQITSGNLPNDDFLNDLVTKQLKINELSEQNQRLSQILSGSELSLFKCSKALSTNPSDLDDIICLKQSISKLKLQNDSLIYSVYEKDMKISDLSKRLKELPMQKTIEALETVHSDQEAEQ